MIAYVMIVFYIQSVRDTPIWPYYKTEVANSLDNYAMVPITAVKCFIAKALEG